MDSLITGIHMTIQVGGALAAPPDLDILGATTLTVKGQLSGVSHLNVGNAATVMLDNTGSASPGGEDHVAGSYNFSTLVIEGRAVSNGAANAKLQTASSPYTCLPVCSKPSFFYRERMVMGMGFWPKALNAGSK